ncbi:MAG TPA: alpha/beta hydrolase [Dehalococcoidia bacterium]|nr:alpha/beta hydrolase [Dehalococcoidia bacterium]
MPESLTIDPRVFHPDAIDPETAAFNAQLAAQLAAVPGWYEPESAPALRALSEGLLRAPAVSPMAEARRLPGPHGEMPVRVFVPDTVRGVYLDIHGGGWVIGTAEGGDLINERIARACEVAVVSVDYRLAPEHPYPAPADDCEAAALWLVRHARSEFGAERLLIGGGSAGGQLAAVTLLRLRDRHGFRGFAGANLVFGCYDLTMTPSHARFARKLVLSQSLDRWFFDQFVPDPAMRRDPDISPLYADLHDLPPALFTVGTEDPLLDDSLFMYARWLAAGNRAELAVYAGGAHGFTGFPLPLAEQANARMLTFIRDAVA